jgi:RNA polymerase sigma-70 factor (ECF subfamily)
MSAIWRDLRTIVEEHQSMVFSVALRITGDRGVAEEVAQDVFLDFHRHREVIESAEHARFWLRKVATHRAIDRVRHSALLPEADVEDLNTLAGGDGDPGDPMLRDRMRKLVACLPEKLRAVIVLRYQEDLKPAEIAETLGIPIATVKSNLHRGLEILRRKTERVLR